MIFDWLSALAGTVGLLLGYAFGRYSKTREYKTLYRYFQSMPDPEAVLIKTLRDCVDSLEYVQSNYISLSGYGVRAERIAAARNVLEKVEGAQ